MERISPHLQAAYKEHPWLHYHPDTLTTYLPPNYYDKLLKEYTFNGRSDLDYFQEYVNKHFQPQKEDVLEIGFGSGRATDLLVDGNIGFHSLDLVDLSKDMVTHGREKYARVPGVSIFESDSLDYMQASAGSYSAVFSLWGFSYSVHHHMNELGIKAGKSYAEGVITKFITQNLRSGGSVFIVHPDILSDEQRILKSLKQPTISKTKDKQSSSKRVLDSTLEKLEKQGLVEADCLERNFTTSPPELQSLLEQYYGYNWNVLSKLWKGDYRLVAFELIPDHLKIIARLEHACNGQINTNYHSSEKHMRAETTRRLDEVSIQPHFGALTSTLEKLQALFHDLGTEVASRYKLVYPEEAEQLFVAELANLKKLK